MAMSALTILFGDEDRPKAVGVYEGANFLGLPAGPILGGWCLAALAGFAIRERRLSAGGGEPLVDPALFASPPFTWGAVLGGIAGLAMIGVLFVTPQYFQAVAAHLHTAALAHAGRSPSPAAWTWRSWPRPGSLLPARR
jgi:hypothetical protein